MRAITFSDSLKYTDNYPEPKCADGECMVRVHMAGICATDLHITRGHMDFCGVLGHEMVGTVVAGSSEWKNRRVACEINCVCRRCDMCKAGLSAHCRDRTVLGISGRDGCFADLVAVPEHNLHAVPDTISDEEAVFIEPLAAAYQVIKQVSIEPRMQVAVVGSGRLGLLIAQVLASTGCRLEVVGRNPKTLLFCEKKRIQSTSVDDLVPRNDRDVVVECTGSPAGLEIALAMVRPRGTIVLKSTHAEPERLNLSQAVVNEVNIIGSRCGPFPDAINALARREVEVSSMVARAYRIERGAEAFEASLDPQNIKVLLKINPR
ncbi:MAG: alcohol dehydrogenase catalytic domain-containing protein [Phycisphaerae bacterium]